MTSLNEKTSLLPPVPDPKPPYDDWREEDRALHVHFGTNPDPYKYLRAKPSKIIITDLPRLRWWVKEIEEALEREGVKVPPFPAEGRTPNPWSGTKPQREAKEELAWRRSSRRKPGATERFLLKKSSTVKSLEGCQYGTTTDELIGILRVFQVVLHYDCTDFFMVIHLNTTKGHLHVHFFITFGGKNGAKVSKIFRVLYRSTCGFWSTDVSSLLPYLLCPHGHNCTCGLEKCHCGTDCAKCEDRLRLLEKIEQEHSTMEAYLKATHQYGELFVRLGMIPFNGIHHFFDDGQMSKALNAPLIQFDRVKKGLETGQLSFKQAVFAYIHDAERYKSNHAKNMEVLCRTSVTSRMQPQLHGVPPVLIYFLGESPPSERSRLTDQICAEFRVQREERFAYDPNAKHPEGYAEPCWELWDADSYIDNMTLLTQNLGFKIPVCGNLSITAYCKLVFIHLRNKVQPTRTDLRNDTSRVYSYCRERNCFFDATKYYVMNCPRPSRGPIEELPEDLLVEILDQKPVAPPPRRKWTTLPSPALELQGVCADPCESGKRGLVTYVTPSQLAMLKKTRNQAFHDSPYSGM